MTMPEPSLLAGQTLSPADAADRLGITEDTIRRWAQKRRIGSVKVGRYIRFTEQNLNDFIAANSVAAQGIRLTGRSASAAARRTK